MNNNFKIITTILRQSGFIIIIVIEIFLRQRSLVIHSFKRVTTDHQTIGKALCHPCFLHNVQTVVSVSCWRCVFGLKLKPANDSDRVSCFSGTLHEPQMYHMI